MTPEQLKASILQYAIQGKLVEQRPEEGTAEDLYKAIQEEKQKLIKEGKIKKEKPLDAIAEEDIPFDIPNNWKWTKLGDLVSVLGGKRIPAGRKLTKENTGYIYIRVSDMKNETVITDDLQYIPEDIYPSISRYIINKEDVYITVAGTIGRIGKIPSELDGANLTENADRLVFIILNQDWLIKTLSSSLIQNQIADATTKVGQPKLAIKRIQELLIPLPPLTEQHRIVAKIEELLPFVDRYAASYEKLEQFNAKFPEDMKKSILQYAIQGKLVEQRPEEGTAEELYKAIREEKQKLIKEGKIKKEKPLAEITEDEIPFDIPDSWKWVKLGECINLLSGQDLTEDRYNEKNEGTIYLTGASNLDDNEKIIINRWTTSPTSVAHKGDLLLTCKGTIGKTAILTVDEAHIARQIMAITSIQSDTTYIKYFIKISVDMLRRKAKSMIPGIDRDTVRNLLLPLPPLEEQHRIVSKIEEMLPYCDQLI
jgi:type I restriction enzyme S subunit